MYSLNLSEHITCYRFGKMRQKNGWEFLGERKLGVNLFVFISSGSAVFTIESKPYAVIKGDILIIPANTVYRALTEDYCEFFFFHFSGVLKEDIFQPLSTNLQESFSFNLPVNSQKTIFFELKTSDIAVHKKIHRCIMLCMEYRFNLNHINRLLIDTEFYKILLILGSVMERGTSILPAVLEKMLKYIETNLSKPLSLIDLCDYTGISAPYASRLFKKHLNITATAYINNKKLFYACELIRNTNMNINEISAYLGYSDVSYFSKIFKKKFGKSPKNYF